MFSEAIEAEGALVFAKACELDEHWTLQPTYPTPASSALRRNLRFGAKTAVSQTKRPTLHQGDYLPEGAELLQVTNDPYDAAATIVGDSLLSVAKLALEAFIDAVPAVTSRPAPAALPRAE